MCGNRAYTAIVMASVLFGLFVPAALSQEYLSPLALVAGPDGTKLYVAEFTANRIDEVDAAGGSVLRSFALPQAPSGLAISSDGSRLYAAGCNPAGALHVVGVASGSVEASVRVGHSPSFVVLHPNGQAAYVGNQFNNNVSVVDLASGTESARVPVPREPVAAAITPDGASLIVANLVPAGRSDVDVVAAEVSIIDTAGNAVAVNVPLPNGSTGLRGVCVAPDGRYAYVTHLLARFHMPTTQLERGWMNTNALSIIDVAERRRVNTVLLDDVDLGAANPWGVTVSPDGASIVVTLSGTHEIAVIDRVALHDKLARVAAGERVTEVSTGPEEVPNDLAFLVGIKQRIALTGNGPRGVAFAGNVVYAAEYFTGTLGKVDLAKKPKPRAESIRLGAEETPNVVRKGEMFFSDAGLCFQHWQSCASCHPDARVDGLNWDLLNDGIGNPKNTKNMLLSHKTPPAMSLGVREEAEAAVRAGIKFIQFAVRPEEDAVAIDEYLKSLQPVPSPFLVEGMPGPAAERGKAVFEQAGCISCHPEPLYTDLKEYNVGTGKDREADKEFDTPTLVEVWRTAPYLHDGRAVTLKEVLTEYNAGDKHGVTSSLTDEQRSDLVEYLLTR